MAMSDAVRAEPAEWWDAGRQQVLAASDTHRARTAGRRQTLAAFDARHGGTVGRRRASTAFGARRPETARRQRTAATADAHYAGAAAGAGRRQA